MTNGQRATVALGLGLLTAAAVTAGVISIDPAARAAMRPRPEPTFTFVKAVEGPTKRFDYFVLDQGLSLSDCLGRLRATPDANGSSYSCETTDGR